MLKTIIIDDESKVIHALTKLIEANFDDITLTGTAGNLETGYELILKNKPDLLFLDINLPDGQGFDLLKRFESIYFKVIFITGHEEYAIQAIKFSALDYLLKPINQEELITAVNKARDIIKREEEQVKIEALLENFNDTKALKRIILKTSDFLHVVKIEDIIRCEADNNYTFFFLADGKKILVSKTIKEFNELLKSSGFIRVHQSHLINTFYIDKFVKADGGYILMKDASNVPVSQHNRQLVLKELEKMLYR